MVEVLKPCGTGSSMWRNSLIPKLSIAAGTSTEHWRSLLRWLLHRQISKLIWVSTLTAQSSRTKGWWLHVVATLQKMVKCSSRVILILNMHFGVHVVYELYMSHCEKDIDYLPEKGVDYSDCEVPMQLSAEIAAGMEGWTHLQLDGLPVAVIDLLLKHKANPKLFPKTLFLGASHVWPRHSLMI